MSASFERPRFDLVLMLTGVTDVIVQATPNDVSRKETDWTTYGNSLDESPKEKRNTRSYQ